MLHPDVDLFIRTAVSKTFRPKSILELGSFAMHDHNPRPLFPGAQYVGIDARPGPGVDLVGLAHDVEELLPGQSFDMVLSLQALEHDPYLIPRFRQTISSFGLVPFVHYRQEESQKAGWDGKPIGLLFIDGDHTVEGVALDWLTWAPRIAPGGIVAIHDSDMDGPKGLVDLIRANTYVFKVVKEVGNMCIVKKEII